MLLASYGENRVSNPEIYSASIAAILGEYPQVVIDIATDPRTGIQNETDKPPTIKQLRKFCDAERSRQLALQRAREQPKVVFDRTYVPPPDIQGRRANTFVGPLSPNYAAVEAYVKSAVADKYDWKYGGFTAPDGSRHTGIWIALHVYDRLRGGATQIAQWQTPSDAALRARYTRKAEEIEAP